MTRINKSVIYLLMLIITVGWTSCGDDTDKDMEPNDDFDRAAMLAHWADGFIISGYDNYLSSLGLLKDDLQSFETNPTLSNLQNARAAFNTTYLSWQRVSTFEIGKAEEISLYNNTNIYPTNSNEIENNVATAAYNLDLPSSYDAQGLPAIEYLLFGLADTDTEILDIYTSTDQGYSKYSEQLINRLIDLTSIVNTDWTTGYRESFIANDGSAASASVNKLVNDYIFHFERFIRSGKVGLPAGVFSTSVQAGLVESLYQPDFSKQLLIAAYDHSVDFYLGNGDQGSGSSLSAYVIYIQSLGAISNVDSTIKQKMDAARMQIESLENDIQNQISTDNTKMLNAYDAMQELVVLMKIDMLSALNIKVDYIDADGD